MRDTVIPLLSVLVLVAVAPGMVAGAVPPDHAQAPDDAGPSDVDLPDEADENASDAGDVELPENATDPSEIELPENASVADGELELPENATNAAGEVDLDAVGLTEEDLEALAEAGVEVPDVADEGDASEDAGAPDDAGPPEDAGPPADAGPDVDELPDVVSEHLPF